MSEDTTSPNGERQPFSLRCFACGERRPNYVDALGIAWHWLCFDNYDQQED